MWIIIDECTCNKYSYPAGIQRQKLGEALLRKVIDECERDRSKNNDT